MDMSKLREMVMASCADAGNMLLKTDVDQDDNFEDLA